MMSLENFLFSAGNDPQRSYMWEFNILSPFALGQDIKYQVKTISVPMRAIETTRRSYAGVKYFVPMKENSPNAINITLWDREKLGAYRFFRSWMDNLDYGGEGLRANPKTYQRLAVLNLLESNNSRSATIFLFDCYPVEMGDVPLSYMDSSEFTFDVKLQFSRMEFV